MWVFSWNDKQDFQLKHLSETQALKALRLIFNKANNSILSYMMFYIIRNSETKAPRFYNQIPYPFKTIKGVNKLNT